MISLDFRKDEHEGTGGGRTMSRLKECFARSFSSGVLCFGVTSRGLHQNHGRRAFLKQRILERLGWV